MAFLTLTHFEQGAIFAKFVVAFVRAMLAEDFTLRMFIVENSSRSNRRFSLVGKLLSGAPSHVDEVEPVHVFLAFESFSSGMLFRNKQVPSFVECQGVVAVHLNLNNAKIKVVD